MGKLNDVINRKCKTLPKDDPKNQIGISSPLDLTTSFTENTGVGELKITPWG